MLCIIISAVHLGTIRLIHNLITAAPSDGMYMQKSHHQYIATGKKIFTSSNITTNISLQ